MGPMLAKAGDESQLDRLYNHVYEPKYDGVRCLAYFEAGKITLYSRSMKDMTYQFPDVIQWLQAVTVPQGLTIIDGEITSINFQALQTRLQRKELVYTAPAEFKAFDDAAA